MEFRLFCNMLNPFHIIQFFDPTLMDEMLIKNVYLFIFTMSVFENKLYLNNLLIKEQLEIYFL